MHHIVAAPDHCPGLLEQFPQPLEHFVVFGPLAPALQKEGGLVGDDHIGASGHSFPQHLGGDGKGGDHTGDLRFGVAVDKTIAGRRPIVHILVMGRYRF